MGQVIGTPCGEHSTRSSGSTFAARLASSLVVMLLVCPTGGQAAPPEPAALDDTSQAPSPPAGRVLQIGLEDAFRKLDAGPAGAMVRAELDRILALQRRAFWAFFWDLDATFAFGVFPTCTMDPSDTSKCTEDTYLTDFWSGGWKRLRPGFDLSLDGTLLLYTFGKLSGARAQAAAGREAVQHGGDDELGKLALQIKSAYYGILLGRTLLDLIRDARQRLDRELERRQQSPAGGSWEEEDQVSDLEEPGPAGNDDAAAAPEDQEENTLALLGGYQAEARALEAQAQAGLATALEALRIGVGEPPSTIVEPRDAQLEPVLDLAPRLDQLQQHAQQHNSTLLLAEAGLAVARAETARAEADLWPNLVLRYGLGNNVVAGDCLVDPEQPTLCKSAFTDPLPWAVFALSWDMNYPTLIAKYQEAKAKQAKAAATRDGARLLTELAVSRAHAEVVRQLTVLAARRDGETWARKRRMLAATRCGGVELVDGGGSNASCDQEELARALEAWLKARAARFQATYDLNMAVAALSAAVGQPVGRDVLPPPRGRYP